MSSTKRERSPDRNEQEVSSADYSEAAEEVTSSRKKRRWDSDQGSNGVSVTEAAAALKSKESVLAVQAALAKAKEAAKVQAQIQERLKGMNAHVGGQQRAAGSDWAPLRLDNQGRQVDERGQVVTIDTTHLSTLKINIREKQSEALSLLERVPHSVSVELEGSKHIDPRVNSAATVRERRAFNWVKPGKYTARAQTMRMKQLSRDLRSDDFEDTRGETVVRRMVQLEPIPNVEWWDEVLVGDETYDALPKTAVITNLIHIPVMLAPVTEGDRQTAAAPMAIMLTAKERKKIKRITKKEKQKEEQDKIRLGLMAPPEPKMRLSNFMRVLGNESIMEPSQMEQKVRAQMAARAEKHAADNEARKLTPEQLKEKKRKKLDEDTSDGVVVCVFRAGDLTDGKRRFQVDIHAQQFQLTGVAVLYGNCNLVVVEGGPKNMKKFTRLMLQRIKWVPDHVVDRDSDDEDDTTNARNTGVEGGGAMQDEDEAMDTVRKIYKQCVLVWKGTSAKRMFRNFRFELCRTDALARKVLKDKGVPQYWDMCRNYIDDADAS
mmetsp:Transcript_19918/g.39464  ORF Transcript_19918/g.39464 Transcript_19918/m.39464 type:complete len:547 (+) Transcript_19918:22-1662(+)|eukprot:CAMPEP_0175140922 /NCGR_PEP_ID=MMETSP0087-20121206/11792_1 /TAXON_ID=136419 /ORGANISM="Unknown Unknown, Strain D1" /LENGTH=546 /DNA_ID=CAMNT_0016424227 /DNA_START=18 /DNA_END=1658 /DNA_ORIENTATION=+